MSFSDTLREYLEARERRRFERIKSTPSKRELEDIEEEPASRRRR